jgi:PAS domain S-box-containing protein
MDRAAAPRRPSLQPVISDHSRPPVDERIAARRQRAERRVAMRRTTDETVRKLSQALELTGDGILITDRDGNVEYVNPAFEKIMGCSRHDVVGKQPRVFKSGAHTLGFYRRLWGALLSGEVFRGVLVDTKPDGEFVHLDETITPITDADGKISHVVAAVRDVTDSIRREQLLRHLRDGLEQQSRRIAQTLHDEAGSFLTAAHIGLAEAARDLPPAASERLATVRGHLDGIEERLRNLAHELRPRILDDLGLVPAIEFLARGVEKRRAIQVTVEAQPFIGLPAVTGTAVYRLVQEALTNVSRHANANRVAIRLEHVDRTLRCSIDDDGVGFRVAAALARPGAPGLGLKGTRAGIEALGGTLQISSAIGRGTTLCATIPLEG